MHYCWIITYALLLVIPVVVLVVSMTVFSKPTDDISCSGLFTGDRDSNALTTNKTWQPQGCNLKDYSKQDSIDCLNIIQGSKKQPFRIVFAGDSRIRQLRDGLVLQLTGRDFDWLANCNVTLNEQLYKKHESASMKLNDVGGASVEFIFLKDVDKMHFGKLLLGLRKQSLLGYVPEMLIIGVGAWPIRACTKASRSQETCAKEYERKLRGMVKELNKLAKLTTVLWTPQNHVVESNMWDREFTNRVMNMYNLAAFRVLNGSNVTFWNSYYETAMIINDTTDGLHIGARTKYVDIQILLNYLCNPLPEYNNLWNRGTRFCCSKPMLLLGVVDGQSIVLFSASCLFACFCLVVSLIFKGRFR